MKLLNKHITSKIYAGNTKYPWNNVLYTGIIGQSINSVLSLINQIVYNNNPNPFYSNHSIYNDSASKLFVRAQSAPLKSVISFGNPYL